MLIDLKKTVLLNSTPIRALLNLKYTPLEKLVALDTLFRESEKTELQCLFAPDPSFLPPAHYNLMDYLIDSLNEATNPEEQKTLLANTIFFINSNKAIFARFHSLNSQQFFTYFFTLHTLLDQHQNSLPEPIHINLLIALLNMANDHIKKMDLSCLYEDAATLNIAFQMNQLRIKPLINWIKKAETRSATLHLKDASFIQTFMTAFSFLYYVSQCPSSQACLPYQENLAAFFNLFFQLKLQYSFEELELNSPDHLAALLRLAKDCYQEQSDKTNLDALVNLVYQYIVDSDYTSVAFELIYNHSLSDFQLAKLISFKDEIKSEIHAVLDRDDDSAQTELIKKTFCLDERNQQSQLCLFFMLQQMLTFIAVTEHRYGQFSITETLLSKDTNTFRIIKEIASKYPDLILEIILNAKKDYQLFLLSDSKIKMAVANYIIAKATSTDPIEKKEGRVYLADLLAIHENKQTAKEGNRFLYRYFAIPQETKAPINGETLKQNQNTTSLKFILRQARKYQQGAHLSFTFQVAESSSEPYLVQPFYDSGL